MKNSTSSRFGSSGWILSAPLVMLASGVAVLGVGLQHPRPLRAAPVNTRDSDADGLVDRQELILGTSIAMSDTDRDGFSDTEELARKTSPIFAQLRPTTDRLSVGMTAHGRDGSIHVMIAVYCTTTHVGSTNVELGMQIGGRLRDLTHYNMLDAAHVTLLPAANPGAMVALLDIPIRPDWIHALGEVTFFATASANGSNVATAADKAQLLYLDGMIVLVQTTAPNFVQNLSTSGHAPAGGGSVYRPLPLDGEDEVPANWTPDQICSQHSSPVGVSGAVVTQEVTSAECQQGWDSSCPPSCSSSVGSTHTTIDPVILIGG